MPFFLLSCSNSFCLGPVSFVHIIFLPWPRLCLSFAVRPHHIAIHAIGQVVVFLPPSPSCMLLFRLVLFIAQSSTHRNCYGHMSVPIHTYSLIISSLLSIIIHVLYLHQHYTFTKASTPFLKQEF
ncbi:hypothetical protein BDN72DRAFT_163249 [Pluteus cervinus]|uniref:Uncharacterized protein n=1 Tax=Pluteus cervinus TaxID=181527 RepID=A0ACD3AMA4_9AGAR|nr:hypothetical protein BDN72DRAFT_163249 [Pluteus cervinus]